MPHVHLEASVSVQASARAVFERISNLRRFNEWNPFPSMDPTTVSRHEGPDAGVGAVFHYEGKRLGRGRMELVALDPPHRIDFAMTFWRGSSATHSRSAFVLVDRGDATEVHWTFDEDRGLGMYLLGKALFDRMMTGTFRSGLQTLKALIEGEARG